MGKKSEEVLKKSEEKENNHRQSKKQSQTIEKKITDNWEVDINLNDSSEYSSEFSSEPSSKIKHSPQTSSESSSDLKIDDIKLWQRYKGIVKLKYNYWLFVMLPGWEVEWLLHKKKIKVPEWVRWKDLYNIWDIIQVKAEEFKEVNGEKKVVWTQI